MILHPLASHWRTVKRFESLESDLYAIHGDRLDFTLSCFFSMKNEMLVWCNVHQKMFIITPDNLIHSMYGCIACAMESSSRKQSQKAREEFPAKAEIIHPNKYLYHLVNYINDCTKVEIWCVACNDSFWITPNDLLQGYGCAVCGTKRAIAIQSKKASEKFYKKIYEFNNPDIDYTKAEYISIRDKVLLVCNLCGEEFWSLPHNVLNGRGCPDCADYGFQPSKPAILYYVKVETKNQLAYKVGITNRTVGERFGSEMYKVIILKEWNYDTGREAKDEESKILKQYEECKYNGDPILYNGGNTELFDRDVLNLDK